MQRASAVKKSTGEIKTGGFYEVSISVRNNCPLGPSHEEDMYFGRLMVICGLCYCKLECLCCSMFLQDGPQKFWLQHTYLTLIGMTFERDKNAHLQRNLGATFIRLNKMNRASK